MARKPNPPVTPDSPPGDKSAAPPPADAAAGSPAPGSEGTATSASPLDEKFALPVGAAAPVVPTTKPPVKQLIADKVPAAPAAGAKAAADDGDEDDEDDDDEEDDDDDDEDEELVVFTAREAAGAFATVAGFIRPVVANYKKMLAFVVFGVVVETLFNVIMPLSLKFLIDDALGEEDFHELYKILSILGVAGVITSIIAVWYERWDARLSAAVISDVRTRLFEHVQRLPAGYFARTKRGEILSRFSIDMAAFSRVVEILANTALLPFLELVAGVVLMLFLNWQLAVLALLIFPITLIGPRILTPKAVQANYEQKVQEAGLLGLVQENVGAQAVVKAFSLQRKMFGFFSLRNQATRQKMAQATFLTSMVERSVTVAVLMLHLMVLALGAYLATTGQITVGTFVTFESAFWEVSYNIAHLMQFIPVSIQAAAAVRHMQELLDEKTPIADKPGAAEMPRIVDNIAFERVSFAYEGAEQPVIDNLSLK
ncbi:ABC transporter ATP-binding protein, partial [Rhodopseudomonas sp. BR0C11]|uniref:ABC transporter transmembrane domain-containing protein n=1 Tax=Rhodopseudomonas sp. BR0C11 TaxID=2269370 RepID=UPI0013E0CF4B